MTKRCKPTMGNAVKSFCWDCLGRYTDGKQDCENPRCPLYLWMPYRDKESEPDMWWTKWNPKKVGFQAWKEPTPEQVARARAMVEARLARK